MLFSSVTFLLYFLPFVTLITLLIRGNKWKNLFLMIASMVFFAWGDTEMIFLLLLSVYVNYILAIAIDRQQETGRRKTALVIALVFNIGLLAYYKYFNFFVININELFGTGFQLQHLILPIGISFYTFHNISYVVDVYKGKIAAQKDLVNIALYISFFPQLIAGPIIRYVDIADQLYHRVVTSELFISGIKRFITGLAKKVLIADVLANVADRIFVLPVSDLNFTASWLGTLCFTLQGYYDFSGYSDMAIGMGRMFGFRFLENFNFPYISKSVQELWQRWHISLSSWFRDYLYIPLGGNRVSPFRLYLNLFIVFLCTGFWHGASWNYIAWGLFHGLFLIFERMGFDKVLQRLPNAVRHAYTMLVFIFAIVFFRTETMAQAGVFFRSMFGLYEGSGSIYFNIYKYIDAHVIFIFILGIIFVAPYTSLKIRFFNRILAMPAFARYSLYGLIDLVYLVLLVFSVMSIANGTFNPFLYFKF